MESFILRERPEGFEIEAEGRTIIRHTRGEPFIRAGRGEGRFEMYRGNFEISERLDELVALRDFEIGNRAVGREGLVSLELRFSRSGDYALSSRCAIEEGRLVVGFSPLGEAVAAANRWRLSLPAEPAERVYGCGEQFSYLDLRGREFPIWTSEQGVGRNKASLVTWQADVEGRAGGDYWWTFFPQPSFVSSRRLWFHLNTSAYARFDFRSPERHELVSWALPDSIVIGAADTMGELVSDLSAWFGRQGGLPDWCYDGVILGMQGGTEACMSRLAAAREAGVPVAGIWAQDWEGVNHTSFGQRLRWNWVWDRERYPGLDAAIRRLSDEGVRFLGYINPYVGAGMSLFNEASARGFLAKNRGGEDYLVDFGEFEAGIVDFTNPEAFEWYKTVIGRELLDLGLSGWMADFGEYLPTDAVLSDGTSAEIAHNAWPAIWARCNREAVDASDRASEVLYFMRAGGPGSQLCCPMMWAGDQNVDWSDDDGLPSVITAALSAGLSGHGLNHSDIGGYTSLYGMRRTKELFMRWAEQAALSPLMRSHEGNRPKENWQFDSDPGTLAHLARMGRLHVALAPYLRAAVAENSARGLPVMRPLFLGHEDDEAAWTIKDQYLLGGELLVAPVIREGATSRRVHLPKGTWVHAWSGGRLGGGEALDLEVGAGLGEPPFFWREASSWAGLFADAVKRARAEA
ncbi:MAG TPA: alpha-glucosidase [Rectinemataceae bacterium]|nr:alpha-glucosidase [Rectinemataceae bacterium]